MNTQGSTATPELAVSKDEFFSLMKGWDWEDESEITQEWDRAVLPLQKRLKEVDDKNPQAPPYETHFRPMLEVMYSSGPPFID
jgi:hypothetical protein